MENCKKANARVMAVFFLFLSPDAAWSDNDCSTINVNSFSGVEEFAKNALETSRISGASHHIDCDEPPAVKGGESPSSVEYFKNLLAEGTSAPLDRFLKLWNPGRGDGSNSDSPFFDCEEYPTGPFKMPQGTSGPIPANCHPDVLYSWGNRAKTDTIFARLSDGEAWSGTVNVDPTKDSNGNLNHGNVFATISPASTYDYGDQLIRFKIKPGVSYFGRNEIGGRPDEITLRPYQFHDFAIHSASVIENISTGTAEIYDEIVRDILRFKSGKRVSVYSEIFLQRDELGMQHPLMDPAGLQRLFFQFNDNPTHSEEKLKENLLELIREILNNEGRIAYNKGSCRNRAYVFSTAFPSYLNPAPTKK
jgi:hypothetical protein